jgi:glycosyltransferase involved in cell wall biosynthesis
MKILVCTFACHPGDGAGFSGGEDLLGWNIVHQIARFHDVTALTLADNHAAIDTALAQKPTPNLHFVYLDLPRWLKPLYKIQGGIQIFAYLWQIRAYFAARALHRAHPFDLFHHVTYANDWMASYIAALLPIPYVRGPGGGAHRTPEGFLKEYSALGRLWESARALGQWLYRRDPFFILGQRRARALLVCNREAFEALPKSWQSKAEIYPVVGVTDAEFSPPAAPEPTHNHFRVLSVGKLIRLKGFMLAIKGFKEFATKYPDAELEIVGDGSDRAYIESLIAESQARISLTRWLPHPQVIQKMRECDVFLFTSLRDGGGAVVVEAMASSKPVVCMDLAGPGLHVTDECGIKIPPISPEQAARDISNTLERLYLNPDLRLAMGAAARVRAKQVYHWDRLGERLREIYEQALDIPIVEGKAESNR